MIKDQEGQDLQIRNIWSKYREYVNKAYIFMIWTRGDDLRAV